MAGTRPSALAEVRTSAHSGMELSGSYAHAVAWKFSSPKPGPEAKAHSGGDVHVAVC